MHGEEKLRKFLRIYVEYFSIYNVKYDKRSATPQTEIRGLVILPLICNTDIHGPHPGGNMKIGVNSLSFLGKLINLIILKPSLFFSSLLAKYSVEISNDKNLFS